MRVLHSGPIVVKFYSLLLSHHSHVTVQPKIVSTRMDSLGELINFIPAITA